MLIRCGVTRRDRPVRAKNVTDLYTNVTTLFRLVLGRRDRPVRAEMFRLVRDVTPFPYACTFKILLRYF